MDFSILISGKFEAESFIGFDILRAKTHFWLSDRFHHAVSCKILSKEHDPIGFEIMCRCAEEPMGKRKIMCMWDPESQFSS
jgi:hypothetical protein